MDNNTGLSANSTPQCWGKLYFQARQSINTNKWLNAAITYQEALLVAESQLSKSHNSSDAIKRYVRTAMEFAYSLRMGNIPCDFHALVTIVKHHLQNNPLPSPLEHIISPLQDIAFSPKNKIEHWMKILFAVEEKKINTLH